MGFPCRRIDHALAELGNIVHKLPYMCTACAEVICFLLLFIDNKVKRIQNKAQYN